MAQSLEKTCPQPPQKVDDMSRAASATMQSSQQHTAQGVSMAAKILNVDEAKLVRAAGGVVRRNGSRGAMRIAVVHRPGYDDWSFPKGKVDRGETLEETALREVEEETGLRCKLVSPLGCTAYADHKGRDKVACYWLMDVVSGRFRAGSEIDEVRWVTIDDALDLLSYRRDRALLRALDLEATG
jgi:8-oxo-dGTP pyrophosphatase MutT (NUDIX family)